MFFVVEPDRAELTRLARRLRNGQIAPIVGAVIALSEAPTPLPAAAARRGRPSSVFTRNERPAVIRTRSASILIVTAAAAVLAACTPTAEPSAGGTAPTPARSDRPHESLKPLLEQALPNVDGKTFTSAIVDFPPAAHAVPTSSRRRVRVRVRSRRICPKQARRRSSTHLPPRGRLGRTTRRRPPAHREHQRLGAGQAARRLCLRHRRPAQGRRPAARVLRSRIWVKDPIAARLGSH